MMKLIPEEHPENISKQKKAVKTAKPVKPAQTLQFQQKAQREINIENGILQTVTVKLARFMKNSSRATEQEMSELIHSLQRTVLTIQRIRHKKHKADHKRGKK
jgi:hypothetical protein